eukprot:scaffold6096_cov39-Cyclotella_meneghiniana.AAC.1
MEAIIASDVQDAQINDTITAETYMSLIQADLSKKETVQDIADYVIAIDKKQMDAWATSELNIRGAEQRLAEMGGRQT